MRIGVSFPTVEIGADLAVVRDFVHTAEELGYTHLRILDMCWGLIRSSTPRCRCFTTPMKVSPTSRLP
jgi:hypothetical protein